MMEWGTSDQDIESTEKLLLPKGAHFQDDARNVIRCWHSIEVSACPGSGKTTVLLAKLKLLADRMPLENGAGICVLSHTNVAVNQVKQRLSGYADRLLQYPNYIGTLQSFVDRFITLPFLRRTIGKNVLFVDDDFFAQNMLREIRRGGKEKYRCLNGLLCHKKEDYQCESLIDVLKKIRRKEEGLFIGDKMIASNATESARQYDELFNYMVKEEGIIRYEDSYLYAKEAVNEFAEMYPALFSSRFMYVFVDEYQDCDETQRELIDKIYDSSRCMVMKIGDPDQAIYNSYEGKKTDWKPSNGSLPIVSSCRFGQEIADLISQLNRDQHHISSLRGNTEHKPVLIVFDKRKEQNVINEFIKILDKKQLFEKDGIYKVIGAVKKEDIKGLIIGSYWPYFDSTVKAQSEYSYCSFLDEIVEDLSKGKLYRAERVVRKLLCRLFHYAKVEPVTGVEFTLTTLKRMLDEEYSDLYRQRICGLADLKAINRQSIDREVRRLANELAEKIDPEVKDVFDRLPDFFLKETKEMNRGEETEKNVLIDPARGRRIVFDTIHGVKGETHDATLYLETERNRGSDLGRCITFIESKNKNKCNSLTKYSRKLAYVGMSRPQKLLCIAMKKETYGKGKTVFDKYCDVIHI